MFAPQTISVNEAYRLYCQFELGHAKDLERQMEAMTESERNGCAETFERASTPISLADFSLSYNSMRAAERLKMCEIWLGGYDKWNQQLDELEIEGYLNPYDGASLYNSSFDYFGSWFPDK